MSATTCPRCGRQTLGPLRCTACGAADRTRSNALRGVSHWSAPAWLALSLAAAASPLAAWERGDGQHRAPSDGEWEEPPPPIIDCAEFPDAADCVWFDEAEVPHAEQTTSPGDEFRALVERGALSRIAPVSASASRHLTGEGNYPPGAAFDGTDDTAWAVRDFASGRDWVEARFARPVDVEGLRIATGYLKTSSRVGDLFALNDHLRSARIETDQGAVDFSAGRDQRRAYVPLGHRTTRVRLVVTDVWRGTRWRDLSLSEIEVFGRVASEPRGAVTRPAGVPQDSVVLRTVAHRASRSHEVGRTRFEASSAFDGARDTAWLVDQPRAGQDWVEGCFDTGDGSADYEYHLLHGVSVVMGYDKVSSRYGDLFLLNAGVLEANVLDQDGTVLGVLRVTREERTAWLSLPADREVTARCVRIVPTRIRPGTRWQQLAISEVQLWGSSEALVE